MKITQWKVLHFPPGSSAPNSHARRKQLRSSLALAGPDVIISFSGFSTLDHEDVEVLLDCLEQAARRNTQLRLVTDSDVIRVLLEVTRIASVVPVFDSIERARNNMPNVPESGFEFAKPSQSQQRSSA